MRSTLLSLALFILVSGRIAAQYSDPFPPAKTPDRIVLTWSANPATTQSVTWRTDVSVREAFAEIALAGASPDFQYGKDTVYAKTELLVSNNNAAHYHSVTFVGLQPNTTYAYRVGDRFSTSEWFQFTTAQNTEAPFKFLYFGDAQNDLKSMWSRVIREAFKTEPRINFMLHAGDLVNIPNNDAEWGEWFYAGGWMYGMIPSIACPGNHEYYRVSDDFRDLSIHWRPTFTFPQNGPRELPETVYFTDYQGARIISLNSQAMKESPELLKAQKNWLEQVLKDNPNKWTLVTMHHPVYSTAQGRDNEEIREALQPVFEKFGVDLVLQGHDHSYGRGFNPEYSGKRSGDKGPVYVVSVSGPKMYNLGFENWLDRAGGNIQLFQVIGVDGDRLTYEAYTATGQLYDAFQLEKDADRGFNRFIDRSDEAIPEQADMPAIYKMRMSEEAIQVYQQRFEAYKARKAEKKH